MKIRVAVIYGGRTGELEVSVSSAKDSKKASLLTGERDDVAELLSAKNAFLLCST